jgi:hypothetical protein
MEMNIVNKREKEKESRGRSKYPYTLSFAGH